MKTFMIALMLPLLSVFSRPANAQERASVGISISDGQIRDFTLSIGDYDRIPDRQVVELRDCGVAREDMPIVLYMSAHSRYTPWEVARMHRRGISWVQISDRCGIRRDVYRHRTGPPYGNAYGYWKKHDQGYAYEDRNDRGREHPGRGHGNGHGSGKGNGHGHHKGSNRGRD